MLDFTSSTKRRPLINKDTLELANIHFTVDIQIRIVNSEFEIPSSYWGQ